MKVNYNKLWEQQNSCLEDINGHNAEIRRLNGLLDSARNSAINCSGELNKTKSQLNSSLSERDRWMDNYAKTKKELDVLKIDYNLLESDVEEKSNEISRLYGVKNNLQMGIGAIIDTNDGIKGRVNGIVTLVEDGVVTNTEVIILQYQLRDLKLVLNDFTAEIEDIKSSVEGM